MFQKRIDTGTALKLPLPQDAWLMYQFENHEIIRLDLEPGEGINNHVNDWRIVFYVLEGSGTLNVEGKDFQLISHQTIAVEAGLNRYWTNKGTDTLCLLVIKTKENGDSPI